MSDKVTNDLIYEILKSLQEGQNALREDVRDIKADMIEMKGHLALFMQAETRQDATLARLELRVDRIERRLELHD